MTMGAESLRAYQRFNSRGKPTVMARLGVKDNGRIISVQSLVPSGASTGSREALELRDGGEEYLGFGVSKAIENVGEIARAISGLHVTEQKAIDERIQELDGTEDKSRLGANATLAVSLAVARAGAEYSRMPLFKYLGGIYFGFSSINILPTPTLLPRPMMNVINGGVHARNGLAIQEVMIVPTGARNFAEAMRMGTEVYGKLGKMINSAGVGDEGGYSPRSFNDTNGVHRTHEVLRTLVNAIGEAGYEPGRDIAIAIDAAASEFYRDGEYHMGSEGGLNQDNMLDFYEGLVREFPVISIEDGMAESDERGFKMLTRSLGHRIQIVGDDIFCTNPTIFRRGIAEGIANAILVKPNQIGTLSETLSVLRIAEAAGYGQVISHRSGETEDTFIADLAVGTRARQIKTGAPARGERTAKYNRLLDIEEIELPELGLLPEYT